MTRKLLIAAIPAVLLISGTAYTADQRPPARAEQHGNMAAKDYMAAMQDMHQAMMRAEDADADRAFALKMIEHHKGGIAMGNVLLKHGGDAELKRMTQKMIDGQTKEVGELQSWLDRHGGRAGKS
jgi:uncharacterized protein (DUF305 family)